MQGTDARRTRKRAKALRSQLTDAEMRLWYHLRGHRFLGLKFKRQYPVGPYIVDFVCLQHGLAVELDGGQHVERNNYDARRTAFLQGQGFTVLRFWNDDVLLRTEIVLDSIRRAVEGPV